VIDFSTVLKDIDGKPIPDGEGQATLGRACANALLIDDRDASGDEKVKRFLIATKIRDAKKINDLPVEDIALIKKLVAKAFPPLIVGRCWEILDPKKV